MNRAQALAKLKPILGSKLAYREDPKALVGEEREAMRETARVKRDAKNALIAARDARCKVVLAADAEYQALCKQAAAAVKELEHASYYAHHYRISVGVDNGLFFAGRAQGDNWDEVVEKITASR